MLRDAEIACMDARGRQSVQRARLGKGASDSSGRSKQGSMGFHAENGV